MAKVECKGKQCPITVTQNLIGGKWKIIILWMLSEKTRRFNELQKLLPSITQGMLTQQLRELENDGLVHREVYREVPPKVEYSLTPIGQSFVPVMKLMGDWGTEYLKHQERTVKFSNSTQGG